MEQIRTLPPQIIYPFFLGKAAIAMNIGVWMSSGVLAHKREVDYQTQTWNLRELPEEFSRSSGPYRMFVAVDGYWRGFFVLKQIGCNMQDKTSPWTVAFDPRTWTPVAASRAPQRDRRLCYSLDVPTVSSDGERENENKEREKGISISPLERE